MLNLRLATVSLNQTPLDWSGNTERILEAIRLLSRPTARTSGEPDVVLFPELCITGYGCEDAFHSPDVSRRAWEKLQAIARESRRILPDSLIFVGLPVRHNDFVYNCMAVVHDGRVRGIIPKMNLAGDGVHYEPRWFAYYRGDAPETIRPGGDEEVLFGSLILEFHGAKIGVEICEDSWVAARPALGHLQHGTDVILNPAASHFARGKQEIRRNIVLESSRALCCTFVMVNLLGNEAGRLIYDGGSIIASNGKLLHESERFSFRDILLNELEVDLEVNRVQRSRIYSYREQKNNYYQIDELRCHLSIDSSGKGHAIRAFGSGEGKEERGTEASLPESRFQWAFASDAVRPVEIHLEFLRAVSLGLFDYFRKTFTKGFVISLSGGADSACVTLLIHRMVLYAVSELGLRGFLSRTSLTDLFATDREESQGELSSFIEAEKRDLSPEEGDLRSIASLICGKILHTIYQATENSSETTRNAARDLALACHSDHHEYSVQEVLDLYRSGMEKILGRTLDWARDDLSLQNIQARVRSPMAWFFANATGSLLLTTSNRSEAAVGYCTMDGDTSGGLAPIAGVSKDFVRSFLRFMEYEGDPLGGAVPTLRSINEQSPTAELRPRESKQTDEADLMPYDLLDQIEKLAIRDHKPPAEVCEVLLRNPLFAHRHPEKEIRRYVARFFTLWTRNQWKRERYAPSFHLDDENLDPRTWYRFPILSGGYAEELSELEK